VFEVRLERREGEKMEETQTPEGVREREGTGSSCSFYSLVSMVMANPSSTWARTSTRTSTRKQVKEKAVQSSNNPDTKSSTILWTNSIVVCSVVLSILIRYLTSHWPYSGQGTPPIFGDYECQRHWQEITVNLPTNQWYVNSSRNDLNYWGLDYPPLSAFHMKLNGLFARHVAKQEKWVQLEKSRGFESRDHKEFMRMTVLVTDLIFLFSAVLYGFNDGTFDFKTLASVLFYPGMILIDHGHFQYNCVSIGLTLWAIYFIHNQMPFLSSAMFSLALNYKQISLYHALPFFFYLLGFSLSRESLLRNITCLVGVAFTVIVVFGIVWSPFLFDINDAVQVFKRLFPVSRGLFEDKVSNIWCPLDVLLKLKRRFSPELLFKMSGGITFISVIPSGIHLLMNPSVRNFKYNLVISGLSFFLFSFQVHEKGILVAAVPACLLVTNEPILVTWFLTVSTLRYVFRYNLFYLFPDMMNKGNNLILT